MGEICSAQKHYASEGRMTFFLIFFFKSSIFMNNTQENVTARN